MSTPIYQNDLEDENSKTKSLISSVSSKVDDLNLKSQLSVDRIKEMQESVATLKSELQGIVVKVEQNVEIFKGKITSKIALVLNLLKMKQSHIQHTLDNCYKLIDNLVETFLNVGYELERDITVISIKVNDFDTEIQNIMSNCHTGSGDTTLWFINGEGKLTKRKNIVLSSALPTFKCGDKKLRKSFIKHLKDVFTTFQVPNDLWVKLASNQLIGMARDWWNIHDKEITWLQFVKCFIDWTFSDYCVQMKGSSLANQNANEFNRANSSDIIKASLASEQNIKQCSQYSDDFSDIYECIPDDVTNEINTLSQTSRSHLTLDNTINVPASKSSYTLRTASSEDSDEEISLTPNSDDKTVVKRKYSFYTTANAQSTKKRKGLDTNHKMKETQTNSSSEKGKYLLRKRKI